MEKKENMYTRQKWSSTILGLLFFGINFAVNAQSTAISVEQVPNLHKVSHRLYRSAQPKKDALPELERLGVITLLNLRNFKGNKGYKGGSNIRLKQHRINSWRMNYSDLLTTFKIFLTSDEPLLVHCKHGADRTGVFVAVYRIVFEDWSKEEAINELRNGGFGFHEKYFNYMIELVENLDVSKLKSDLNID